jgi:hypothetical protein
LTAASSASVTLTSGVLAIVGPRVDLKASAGAGGCDQVDGDLAADQRLAAPVLADEAE